MAESSDVTWTCTAQSRRGRFCDRPSMPDAPFPICFRHGGALMEWMRRNLGQWMGQIGNERADYLLSHAEGLDAMAAAANIHGPVDRTPKVKPSVLYYVRVGRYIKIGRTTNLIARIGSYPPGSELLATEPGGSVEESLRLRQFGHLLTARQEWFRPGDDLMEHIAALGAPQPVAW